MSVLGGGERVCLHIVKSLVEEGHQVTLVSEPVEPVELEESLGLSILRNVKQVPYDTFKLKIKRFSVYQRVLHHNLVKNRLKNKMPQADLEILTQDVAFLCDVGKKKVAYVHYPEYLVHLEGATPKSKWFWKGYYAPLLRHWRRQIGKVDFFLCNSRYTRRAIREKWGKEAEVVYPPVDVEKIKPAPKEEFVVTIGRFVKEKNYEMIVNTAKLMPEVRFVIMGRKQDEGYYEMLRQWKPSNVTLLTDLPQIELFTILARAKVYLHTMIGEHFGISIVEAMAAGCIPIVHNSGGTKEAIGDFGHIYNDAKECSDSIRQALRKDVDASKIAEYAKRFSAENFRRKTKEKMREWISLSNTGGRM